MSLGLRRIRRETPAVFYLLVRKLWNDLGLGEFLSGNYMGDVILLVIPVLIPLAQPGWELLEG